MKSCALIQILVTHLLVFGVTRTTSFTPTSLPQNNNSIRSSTFLQATAKTVEVCGFKDCKRAGGGPRLEKLVNSVVEENGLVDVIKVEGCECQGECGYGPNLVVDGKVVNSVKGKEAVIKALGIVEIEN